MRKRYFLENLAAVASFVVVRVCSLTVNEGENAFTACVLPYKIQ